jgi:hypothetical protein
MSEQNPHHENSGALFLNSSKWIEQGKGRPDFSGEAEIDGKRWRISGWKKQSKRTGMDFISLAFQPAKESEKK